MKHTVCKVVAIVSILSLLSGLFGCGGNKKYTVDDIVFIHTVYYGMESNPVYSFAMRKEEEDWFFSAKCLVGNNKEHYASFASFPITDEDAQGFLQVIREDGEIERLFKHRNILYENQLLIVTWFRCCFLSHIKIKSEPIRYFPTMDFFLQRCKYTLTVQNNKACRNKSTSFMAERVGFEPTVGN